MFQIHLVIENCIPEHIICNNTGRIHFRTLLTWVHLLIQPVPHPRPIAQRWTRHRTKLCNKDCEGCPESSHCQWPMVPRASAGKHDFQTTQPHTSYVATPSMSTGCTSTTSKRFRISTNTLQSVFEPFFNVRTKCCTATCIVAGSPMADKRVKRVHVVS